MIVFIQAALILLGISTGKNCFFAIALGMSIYQIMKGHD